MSYDYEAFRFSTNVNVGTASGKYAGFASYVDGKVGSAFVVATAVGAMMGLYNITVASGAMAVISVGKTTKQNNGSLKLAATSSKPSEKTASSLKADSGFADVVTAVDGTIYRILKSSAYVVVNSSHFNYSLSATQSVKAKALFDEVEKLLGSSNWRAIWDVVARETLGTNVDVISWVYKNIPETRSVIDGCNNILGEVPVVTYALDVKNGVDTEAPTIDKSGISVIFMGNKIKAECTGAKDNFFVYGFQYQIVDQDDRIVETGSVSGTETIRPKAALGDGNYTLRLKAYDYAGNVTAEWVDTAFKVSNNLYVDADALENSVGPLVLSQPQTVEKSSSPLVYSFTAQYSGSYNLILKGLDSKAKVTITEYDVSDGKKKKLRSKTMTWKNFENGVGNVLFDKDKLYEISVSSNTTANYEIAVEGVMFKKANQVPEDNWSDLKKVHAVTSDMKVMVQSDNQRLISDEWVGFTDKLDVRELEITTASRLSIELISTDKARMSLYVEQSSGQLKKLKSISVGASKTGSATKTMDNLLLGVGTYYLVVESPNAKKGGNANYSVSLTTGTEIFTSANMNPLDNNPGTAPFVNGGQIGTLISGEWVGFSDQYDYFRIAGIGNGGAYEFGIDGANDQLRLTVYQVVKEGGGEKLKVVKQVTSSAKTDWAVSTGSLLFGKGKDYIVAVESPKASKGAGSAYSLELKQAEIYNWDNNTLADATVLTDAFYRGILSKAADGDTVDYIDLRQFAGGDLSIDMAAGKAKVSFLSADGDVLYSEKINTKKSVEFSAADCSFLWIEADSKKGNQYAITLA